MSEFTEEQKSYLQGFAAGCGLGDRLKVAPTFMATLGRSPGQLPGATNGNGANGAAGSSSPVPAGPEAIHFHAQDKQVAAGKKLVPEEVAKRKRFPLDVWDDIVAHAKQAKYPQKLDVLAFKYNGIFYVAPAQDSYMARLRFPGGIVPSFQLRRVADIAERYAGGYADCTTRANLQLREIKAGDPVNVLEGLHDAGIVIRGSGADNIRNVTGSPTAGIDPIELYDTRALSRAMHHHILNHRELYGLPRKFNIAFDGGGAISSVEDTNDIGFTAVRVGEGKTDADGKPVEPGVYFRLGLGGITGHKDFARDEGLLLTPDELIPVAHAILLVFIENGDRSDRRKARLKYVLDALGHEKYVAETEKLLGRTLRRLPLDQCEPRNPVEKHGHIGFHPQRQPGLFYVGVLVPVGRMTSSQMRGLADLADRHGSGTIRLTVWQNLLISDIPEAKVEQVKGEIEMLGLNWRSTSIEAGLVACTGAAGCKFAMAHTKQHALRVAEHIGDRLKVYPPVNVHLTGCPNSCAQHYMGDLGMIGTKVEVGEDEVEGYHMFVGGGYGADQAVGRELYRSIPATELPVRIEKVLRGYLSARSSDEETFNQFVRRHEVPQLVELFDRQEIPADAPATEDPASEPTPDYPMAGRGSRDGSLVFAQSGPG